MFSLGSSFKRNRSIVSKFCRNINSKTVKTVRQNAFRKFKQSEKRRNHRIFFHYSWLFKKNLPFVLLFEGGGGACCITHQMESFLNPNYFAIFLFLICLFVSAIGHRDWTAHFGGFAKTVMFRDSIMSLSFFFNWKPGRR